MTELELLVDLNKNSDLASKVIQEQKSEIELYMKFKDYYSYGFYIAKKTGEL